MNKIIKATLIISIIRIFDMITTYFAIKKFGILAEGNLLIRFQIELFNNLGLALLVHYVWVIFLTYFGFVLIDYLNRKSKNKVDLFKRSFWALVIIFSLVPIWNIFNIIFG